MSNEKIQPKTFATRKFTRNEFLLLSSGIVLTALGIGIGVEQLIDTPPNANNDKSSIIDHPTSSTSKSVDLDQLPNGVTLFVGPDYMDKYHTFTKPGTYDLGEFGLDGNVSSVIMKPNHEYHITLRDTNNRPGYFDASTTQLPADWNDQAHTILVELKNPEPSPTS